MDSDYHQFTLNIHKKIGVDLKLYKEAQMKRRLDSLRQKRNYPNYQAYFKALEADPKLLKEFVDRITINVSEFYRNPKRWEILRNKVIPYLIEKSNQLTIWSAACSTGEEPYSIAIMLTEYFPQISFEIIASDLDETVLIKAKQAVYQKLSLKNLPLELKKKYFTEKNGLFYLDSNVKRNIVFKQHNLLSSKYPNNLDLIVCRNVLIYFTEEAKNSIFQNFSKSLKKNGVLFLGSTEQIFNSSNYELTSFDSFFYEKQ